MNVDKQTIQAHPVEDYIMGVIDSIRQIALDKEMKMGLTTGFNSIDEVTGGFQGGDLITIAGSASTGKTSFALSIARNIAMEQKIPTLFFSFEMSAESLVQRIIASVCDISLSKITNAYLCQNDWTNLDGRIQDITDKPLFIEDMPGMGKEELIEYCRYAVPAHAVKIIFIDCLQLINWNYHSNRSIDDELSEIIFSLKSLAKELNIPIVLLSFLNGTPKNDGTIYGVSPKIKDLPGKGSIESISDYVLLLHRPELYHIYQDEYGRDLHNVVMVEIVKNARGYCKDVYLEFDAQTGNFTLKKEILHSGIHQSPAPPFL